MTNSLDEVWAITRIWVRCQKNDQDTIIACKKAKWPGGEARIHNLLQDAKALYNSPQYVYIPKERY